MAVKAESEKPKPIILSTGSKESPPGRNIWSKVVEDISAETKRFSDCSADESGR